MVAEITSRLLHSSYSLPKRQPANFLHLHPKESNRWHVIFHQKVSSFLTLVRGKWKYRDEIFRDITNWVFLTPPRKLWKTISLARKQTKTSQVLFTGANPPRWINYIFSTPYKVYKSPGQYNEDLKRFTERLWKTWSHGHLFEVVCPFVCFLEYTFIPLPYCITSRHTQHIHENMGILQYFIHFWGW